MTRLAFFGTGRADDAIGVPACPVKHNYLSSMIKEPTALRIANSFHIRSLRHGETNIPTSFR